MTSIKIYLYDKYTFDICTNIQPLQRFLRLIVGIYSRLKTLSFDNTRGTPLCLQRTSTRSLTAQGETEGEFFAPCTDV